MAEQFYSVHSSKPFFGELVSFITSGTVTAAIIEGDNVINVTREIIGKTNPKEASPVQYVVILVPESSKTLSMPQIQEKVLIRK